MNLQRVKKLIEQSISTFSLNLSGSIVLTEAASNYYMLTPLIAARAGAAHVLALTRDSRFGTAKDIQSNLMALADQWNLGTNISVITDRTDDRIGSADIITNLGFVRPLDARFLKQLKKTAAIALMWETWEYRSEDLDLKACRQLDIALLGTNEHHSQLNIFNYLGYVALKLLMETGIEILYSNIIVLGSGEFAEQVTRTLKALNAEISYINLNVFVSENRADLVRLLKKADALIVVDHHHDIQLIGSQGLITADKLSAINNALVVIHICGNVSQSDLTRNGIFFWPSELAPPGHMSVATDYIGPRPLVDLHVAGLKVGERLYHARKNGLAAFEAEMQVLTELDLAQGFDGYHIRPTNTE